jgi:hypothetical protein
MVTSMESIPHQGRGSRALGGSAMPDPRTVGEIIAWAVIEFVRFLRSRRRR